METKMEQFTREERAAIKAAWNGLDDLCQRTNWEDRPQLNQSYQMERQALGDTMTARAMVCRAWLEGYREPTAPASSICFRRPGSAVGLLLGVRHAVENRAPETIPGLMAHCEAAAAALNARLARGLEG